MFIQLVLSFAIALTIVLAVMPFVLPLLRKLKFGQTIYELGPKSHAVKQGTPTMGGLVFAVATVITSIIIHGAWYGWTDATLALLFVSVLSMLIGFLDDYIKIVKKRNLGLIWWQKIIGQLLVSVAFSCYCYFHPHIGSVIIVPFCSFGWNLGIFYIPLMTCMMIFLINSANLQDGLDGLLSSVTIICTLAFVGATLLLFPMDTSSNFQSVGLFAATLCGGCLGFLFFNRYPAKVFMGDTGSMLIGGAIVGMAMLLRMPLFLLFIFFTPIMSSLSVIIQRIYFKVTHGKRIFKMSPIHHHFEYCGMSENKIVGMYVIVTLLLSAIALIAL